MSTLLCQIIAVEPSIKSTTYSAVSKLHHDTQRTQANGPFAGITRTYSPLEDGGEQLPGESTRVQMTVDDILSRLAEACTRMFDVVATKDWANREAKGTVTVDGTTLLEDAPVTYLLFLEKQLNDLHTFVSKLPTLDVADTWHYDANRACWVTEPVKTARTKKVPQNHVLAPSTDKHPAQVQMYHTDEIVGYWETVKLSGALPADRVRELVRRVETLQRAVRYAREQANTLEVADRKVGRRFFDYLFAE